MMKKNSLKLILGLIFLAITITYLSLVEKPTADSNSKLKISILDVGQGDSIYIKTAEGADILIDGGPNKSVLTELGKVMAINDRRIDLVILTHPHADHLSGLVEVINRYEVGELWQTGISYDSAAYSTFKQVISEKKVPVKIADQNLKKTFFETEISVLSPILSLQNQTIDNLNNASIVNLLKYKNISALFLADAEIEVQAQILNKVEKVTLIKAAHHGAENGFLESLYKLAYPAVVVISVGKDNKFNHPSPNVIAKLAKYVLELYRTDQNGTVTFLTDGFSWQVKTSY